MAICVNSLLLTIKFKTMSNLKKNCGVDLLREGMPHCANLLSNDEMGNILGGDFIIICEIYINGDCYKGYKLIDNGSSGTPTDP